MLHLYFIAQNVHFITEHVLKCYICKPVILCTPSIILCMLIYVYIGAYMNVNIKFKLMLITENIFNHTFTYRNKIHTPSYVCFTIAVNLYALLLPLLLNRNLRFYLIK